MRRDPDTSLQTRSSPVSESDTLRIQPPSARTATHDISLESQPYVNL